MSIPVSRRSVVIAGLTIAGGVGLGAPELPAAAVGHRHRPRAGVRVMTWNIHGGVPAGAAGAGAADLERIGAVICAESPDVVVLNEMHQDPSGPGSFGDQPAAFRALLAPAGYRHLRYGVAERDLPRDGVVLPGSTTGNAIVSRHPFVGEAQIVTLPNENYEPGGKNRRSMLTSTIAVPGVGQVQVHATHLSTPGSAALVEDQKEQVQIILENVRTDGLSVLAGDFNIRVTDVPDHSYSQNNLMQSWIAEADLADTWRQVNDSGDGPTFGDPDAPDPDRRIDYVFASPALVPGSGHVSQIDPSASDHFAVLMDLCPQPTRELRVGTVLAGADGLHGWAQLAGNGRGEARLSVCKNHGLATDDGTRVRASVLTPTGRVVQTVSDGGTSRDRATVHTWNALIRPGSILRTSLVQGETVLHTRERVIG